MKVLLLVLFFAQSVGAQIDTFEVESNYLYVVKASISSVAKCKKKDTYSIAEIRIDSILYFNDSAVMKNHNFFRKNARYIYFDKTKFEIIPDCTYYLNIFLRYQYSVFGVKEMSCSEAKLLVKEASGYKVDYPLGPNYYYKRRRLKEIFHVALFGRKSYSQLPKSKTHKIVKVKKPKFLNCIDDF